MKGNYDAGAGIKKFNQGELDEAETIEFFQHLIDSEIIWMLQDQYGCFAKSLIEAGQCRKAYYNTLLHL